MIDGQIVLSDAYTVDFDFAGSVTAVRSWLVLPRTREHVRDLARTLRSTIVEPLLARAPGEWWYAAPVEQAEAKRSWETFVQDSFSDPSIDDWYQKAQADEAPIAPPAAADPLEADFDLGDDEPSIVPASTADAPWETVQFEVLAKYPAMGIGNSRENLAFVRAFLKMGGTTDYALGVADLLMVYPPKP